MKVFAIGTLKAGFPLHESGLKGAAFLGEGRSCERFPLVIAGPWFAPMILHEPGVGHRVRGELYEVDEAVLSRLDALESVGKPGNYRIPIEVECGGDRCAAFVYFKSAELACPRHSGYLDDYQDRRFVPPGCR